MRRKKVSIVRDSVERTWSSRGTLIVLSCWNESCLCGDGCRYAIYAMDLYYDWLYQVNHNNWNVIVPTGSRGKPEPMGGNL